MLCVDNCYYHMELSGLPLDKVLSCMGDPEADAENEVLKNEQTAQVFVGFIRILQI